MAPAPPAGDVGLRRALGRWDLTALGVNQVIGGAIFLMPSRVAAEVGAWSVPAFLLAGLASLLVAFCFAEVSSRFSGTGGPYLYSRVAFGRFVGFEVGWMQWITRVTSYASVANGVALAIGFYWPAVASGAGRPLAITALTAFLAAVMLRGIRQSAWLVNALTAGKLVPLLLFIVIGLPFVDPARLTDVRAVTAGEASTAALLLIFVFGGYDVISVPAGEASDPRRHLPFAYVMTILVVTAVMTLAQVVSIGTLPDLAASSTPLADASLLFMGAAGALMVSAGSAVSMTGNIGGGALSASRVMYALAEQGDLPGWFGRIHPRFRTPVNAIAVTFGASLVLALSGSFVALAASSAAARLLTYAGTCAATLALRRRRDPAVPAPTFVVPLGPVVPLLAIAISVAVLAGATADQLMAGVVALAVGAVLFAAAGRRDATAPPTAGVD